MLGIRFSEDEFQRFGNWRNSTIDVNSDPSSVGTEWKRWLRSFQLYADGKGLIIVPDKDDNKAQRRALLLHCAGSDVQDIFYVLPNTGGAKDYQKAEVHMT